MRILYALQGTGNGHVARARDLVPRFSQYAEVDVLIAGSASDLDLGFPVKFRKYGLAMVYNSNGAVSYWRSLFQNKLITFLKDVFQLPVKDYDVVVIDFEAITSYACRLRGIKALQLSHQAAYWSMLSPRPDKKSLHWEFVLKYMSPAHYKIGFHFERFDTFILPPIIRKEIRQLEISHQHKCVVYLPSYSSVDLVDFFRQFHNHSFVVFSPKASPIVDVHIEVRAADVNGFLQELAACSHVICGAGFETPSEALFLGKSVLTIPIVGQYEQACNAAALAAMGVQVLPKLDQEYVNEVAEFLNQSQPKQVTFPDYAEELVQCIVNNVQNGTEYDDISSLQVW